MNGDAQHLLAAVAKAGGGLDWAAHATVELIDESRQGFTLNVLGNDEQRALLTRNRLEHGQEIHVGRSLLSNTNRTK